MLAGCANVGPNTSYVGPLHAGDATMIAGEIDDFIQREALAGQTTLRLDPIVAPTNADLVTPMLVQMLRKAGFALAGEKANSPDVHVVRYLITPASDGVLLRVKIDHIEGSTFLARDNVGALSSAAMTVRSDAP
jgi:hypothetical protein